MKLLVTGGAGFIGSNFILYWLSHHRNDLVINLDKLTYAGNLDNLKSIEHDPSYKFIKGDICDTDLVREIMDGVDTVVHFAAESHVDRSIKKPQDFVITNVVGTQVLLDIAVEKKVKRFHHVSTDEVFGSLDLNSSDKFNEQTSYNPHSPYSASKAASDHLVRAYADTYGLPITITNCSNNFGPFQFPEKLIPLAITNLLEGKKVPVYGDGLYVRDWLQVEDHCRAIEAVLMNGHVGETYCVGGMTQDISNLEIVKKIIILLGKDESMIEFVKDRPGHDRRYAIDWSKINRELGWHPAYDFETWLEKTVDWYRENREWWKRLKNAEFEKYYQGQYGEES
ncbi:MAG TPA: dTDP-glucose 4,6-dehydratase [Candidatus Levybacteria bacterium]|nr:dTDP-glucose 4,6-dehydratase [Candidatus Levybacteria bacterium]